MSYIIINGTSLVLDLCYKKLGWTIKGPEEYSLEKPDLSLHKAELSTELASAKNADDSASGPLTQLKRKQSAAPLNNPLEDNDAFYARVCICLILLMYLPCIANVSAVYCCFSSLCAARNCCLSPGSGFKEHTP